MRHLIFILFAFVCLFACSNKKKGEDSNESAQNQLFSIYKDFNDLPDLKDFKIAYRCGELIKLPAYAREKEVDFVKYYFDKDFTEEQKTFRKFYPLAKFLESDAPCLIIWAMVAIGADDPQTIIYASIYNSYDQEQGTEEVLKDTNSLSENGCLKTSRFTLEGGQGETPSSFTIRQLIDYEGRGEDILMESIYDIVEGDQVGIVGNYLNQQLSRQVGASSSLMKITSEQIGDFKLNTKFDEKEIEKKYDLRYDANYNEWWLYEPDIKNVFFKITAPDGIIKKIEVREYIAETQEGLGIGTKYLTFTEICPEHEVFCAGSSEVSIKCKKYPNMFFIMQRDSKVLCEEGQEKLQASLDVNQVITAVIIYDEN